MHGRRKKTGLCLRGGSRPKIEPCLNLSGLRQVEQRVNRIRLRVPVVVVFDWDNTN